jgi:uncharacterized tellurite resistance protein B-like protein
MSLVSELIHADGRVDEEELEAFRELETLLLGS